MNYLSILEKQLALDFSVDICDLRSDKNIFTPDLRYEKRRIYEWDNAILKLCTINNKLIMASDNPDLIKTLEKEFKDVNGGFTSRMNNLLRINEILLPYGHKIADCHHYYIPKYDVDFSYDYKQRWFDKDELLAFKGNDDFTNALEFSSLRPDVIGVCSYDKDIITGMAAASCDSDLMWQIGINVNKNYRGKGIGAFLTNELKKEIIKKGVLPFYGTVESHISSQRIALKCGFIPAFFQAYTREC